uniref:Reverse transcriptase domain-containing protein n=1 Tax=Oedocladium prescottii TaxID=337949 RepID=A0A8K1JCY4_9CHLO|nr:hypothetical protein [Oedocladium prescottii]
MNFINGTRCNTNRQSSINFIKFNRIINNLKRRIFLAKQQGRFRTMRKLQKLLITAHSNRLLAVQQVCQRNVGNSNTGLSNFVFLVPSEQMSLVKGLKKIDFNKWKPTHNKLVYSPTSNVKLRVRDVAILINQALQEIVKTALEPEWEPILQQSCYKFRKEHSTHNIIQYIKNLYDAGSIKNWIVKVNIKRCFDSISHDFLTKLLYSFPAKRIIQSWLNIRVGNLSLVKKQNNMIRVLIKNIILHDIKKVLRILNDKREKIKDKNTIFHYSNEFLVACKTKEDALKIKEEINLWLHSRGLLTEDTTIRHIREGFNFLGFNIRLYNNNKYGKQRLIIQPSKDSVLQIKKKLKKMWIESNGFPVGKIINKFNSIILKWTNYFKIGNSSKIFKLLDNFMYRRQLRFAKRAHSRKSCKWIQQRYWRFLYLRNKNKLVFGCKETGAYMLKFTWT